MTDMSGENLETYAAVGRQGEAKSSQSKFPRYPAYKDSGVEWLGEVPEHWTTTSLKYFAELNPKKSDYRGDQGQLCSFIPMEKLKTGAIQLDEVRTIADVITGYTYFEDGDVLQAKVTPCFENGNIAIADGLTNGVGFGSSEINVIRPFKIDVGFLYYRLQEGVFMSICTASMIGAGGLKRVPGEVIDGFTVAIPDRNEQTQIARFLDHETARIDALIAEQQRLIELLKEKRQAVISHAVTKGLDPTVPMKDSGVEWLGEVPAHWEVKKIKHYGRVIGGFAFKSTDFSDEGHLVIKISNVGHLGFEWNDASYLPESFTVRHSEFIAPKGSLIFAMTRPVISGGIKIARLEKDLRPLINQRVGFISINDEALSRYLLVSSQSESFLSQFKNNLTITNQPNIASEGIESISIPIPPAEELRRILEYIETLIDKFDCLMLDACSGIRLLQERRSALISAAVTGKIDVRGWQPPASVPSPELENETV
ncbi:restriction endonuclease subunit S [Nitrosococcus watsonii]|uniref:Restriction modification system DNA specificity domain protein n=1 Tax=Nitrosococcus watsoni (strain C-113) TaxID=105559 RepID=D8KA79_NITWC|nr:restriction endonuclease subunit S [Nitrosococcus watsonii]ADJ27394.1 restriction modification system DNA specificity domain protein [Nitrosococcus watsonii C-113]